MEDLGFILASYVVTFASAAVMVLWVRRRGQRLAAQLPDEDKPWT